jgi:peptidoglycan hydrolase CwlO-like protein
MKKHFLFLGIVIFATVLSFALFNSLTKAQANSSVLSANNNIALQKVEIHQNDIQAELCIFLPSLEQWGPTLP